MDVLILVSIIDSNMGHNVLVLWPDDSGFWNYSEICCIRQWLQGVLCYVWINSRIQAAWNIVVIRAMKLEKAVHGVQDLEAREK